MAEKVPASEAPTDEEQAAALAAYAKLPEADTTPDAEVRAHQDFRQLFLGSDQGQRVLAYILRKTGAMHAEIQGRPIDPYHMAVCAGMRNAGLMILYKALKEPRQPQRKAKQAPRRRKATG